MHKLTAAAFVAVSLFMAGQPASAQSPEPVKVMIIGAYHFGNPGMDLNNARIAPVTTPDKQVELEALSNRLMGFAPTAVAVERVPQNTQTLLDHVYPTFTPEVLTTQPDERYQIGYRLGAKIGNGRVYAIDEQSNERDYFPFEPVMAWWNANGHTEAFAKVNAPIAASMAELERRQSVDSIGDILADMNRPQSIRNDAGFYFSVLTAGDGMSQPGAALNAGWFERNARIVSKLMSVAQPGDRIVVVYGAGHSYWLHQLIGNTPGFEIEDAVPYLAEPAR